MQDWRRNGRRQELRRSRRTRDRGGRAPEHHTRGVVVPMGIMGCRIDPGPRAVWVEVLVRVESHQPRVQPYIQDGRGRPQDGCQRTDPRPPVRGTEDHGSGTLPPPDPGPVSAQVGGTALPQWAADSRRLRTAVMKTSCFSFMASWASAIFPWRSSAALWRVRRDS